MIFVLVVETSLSAVVLCVCVCVCGGRRGAGGGGCDPDYPAIQTNKGYLAIIKLDVKNSENSAINRCCSWTRAGVLKMRMTQFGSRLKPSSGSG